jgi:hypothetical protein
MDVKTYGPQEVCDAAGVSRATFHSWVARKYLPLPPGPGMGRERRFSASEAILVAVAAELTKLGLSIGVAARVVDFLLNRDSAGFWPRVQHEDGWMLFIAPSPAPVGVEAPSLMPAALFRPKTPEGFREIRESLGDPAAAVLADVSVIARRTLERLE